jgi:hypothetical protein
MVVTIKACGVWVRMFSHFRSLRLRPILPAFAGSVGLVGQTGVPLRCMDADRTHARPSGLLPFRRRQAPLQSSCPVPLQVSLAPAASALAGRQLCQVREPPPVAPQSRKPWFNIVDVEAPPDFHTRDGHTAWARAWAKQLQLRVHITVNPSGQDGDGWLGNIQCKECETAPGKKDCPLRWRFYSSADRVRLDELLAKVAVGEPVRKQHAPLNAESRGVSAAEKRTAEANTHQPPLRTLAALCEKADTLVDTAARARALRAIPASRVLQRQRSRSLSAPATQARSAESVTVWRNFVRAIAYSPEEFHRASMFQLFSVPIVGGNGAPPLAVCVSRAMVEYTKTARARHDKGHGMCDFSWKYNVAEWPLCAIGSGTHWLDLRKFKRSTGLITALSTLPKECHRSAKEMWLSVRAIYIELLGFDLFDWYYDVCYDASAGLLSAHAEVMPTVKYFRCLRHQLRGHEHLRLRRSQPPPAETFEVSTCECRGNGASL